MVTITGLDELNAKVGEEIGVSAWHDVTQEAVDTFAQVTGDDQWIHVDVERAARESPFGGTVAHGYYTLSLSSRFFYELLRLEGFALVLNYGVNRVRFPAPLPVGDRVRMRLRIDAVEEVSGGAQIVMALTFERDGAEKPVCVAESLFRVYER